MGILKRIITSRAISASTMLVVLVFPSFTEAVSFGEAVSYSKLGEPLLVQVELVPGDNEHIADSCLSLAAPDPLEKDHSGYLTQANLSIKTEGKRQYVIISTRTLFNDAFARILLQINCPDMGSVTKLLTVLPDLELPILQAPVTVTVADDESKKSVPTPSEPHDSVSDTSRNLPPEIQLEVARHLANQAVRPVHRQTQATVQSDNKAQHSKTARLVLSGDVIDESRFGKTGTEKRERLLLQQKQRDDDEQMVRYLAMQNQIKQLENELSVMNLKLAKMGITSGYLASSAVPLASPVTKEPRTSPNIKLPSEQPDKPDVQKELLITLGLVLSILFLGLLYYAKVKSRVRFNSLQDFWHILKTPENLSLSGRSSISHERAVVEKTERNSERSMAEIPPLPSDENIREFDEEQIILEEAKLYFTHGRPAKAAEILQEAVKLNPSKIDPWYLLLTIYSSLGKTEEFEQMAREFLKHHKGTPTWNKIQELGYSLDKNNPLYAEGAIAITAPAGKANVPP